MGKSTFGKKNCYAKTLYRILIFPRENWLYSQLSGQKFYYIAIFSVGNSTLEKNRCHFSEEKNCLGTKLLPDSNRSVSVHLT